MSTEYLRSEPKSRWPITKIYISVNKSLSTMNWAGDLMWSASFEFTESGQN